MAVLSVDTLTGCSSIPSFLGGTSDTPANPSITVFHNTSAPTNWTKNTSASINNIALRVIGGAEGVGVSTGGTVPFSTVFSPKTSPITSSPSPAGASFQPATALPATTQDSTTITTQDVTFSASETPPHTHPYVNSPTTNLNSNSGGSQRSLTSPGTTSGPGSGPGSHNHGNISAPHTHSISAGHTHPVNALGDHTHSFTLNQNFDILYVDVIIATKD